MWTAPVENFRARAMLVEDRVNIRATLFVSDSDKQSRRDDISASASAIDPPSIA